MTPQNQPEPQSDELEEILAIFMANVVDLADDSEGALNTNAILAQAKQCLEAWGREQRVKELERLSKTKWSDIAYDIPFYLRDRITELLRGKND